MPVDVSMPTVPVVDADAIPRNLLWVALPVSVPAGSGERTTRPSLVILIRSVNVVDPSGTVANTRRPGIEEPDTVPVSTAPEINAKLANVVPFDPRNKIVPRLSPATTLVKLPSVVPLERCRSRIDGKSALAVPE